MPLNILRFRQNWWPGSQTQKDEEERKKKQRDNDAYNVMSPSNRTPVNNTQPPQGETGGNNDTCELSDGDHFEEDTKPLCPIAEPGSIWEKIVLHPSVIMASVFFTLTALLAFDFTLAFLPPEADTSTNVILLIAFVFFVFEIVGQTAVKPNFFLSFWFWLDLIAVISMIPDLVFLLQAFDLNLDDVNLSNTRASKAGKSSRSAFLLRAVRMVRFSRLLRVVRIFRFFQSDEDEQEEETASHKASDIADMGSSKIGNRVTELVTQQVIVLVLILVLVLPWFDPTENSFTSAAESAGQLWSLCIDNGADGDTALSYLKDAGPPILYLKYGATDTVYIDKDNLRDSRRSIEMWRIEQGTNVFIFDIRESVFEEALLGMCLTLFSVMVFGVSALVVANTAMIQVVEPVTRLTRLLLRMAGIIGIMGNTSNLDTEGESNNELFVVEALCERILSMFNAPESNHGRQSHSSSKQRISARAAQSTHSKALQMMASSKTTQIVNGDRVLEIDVKERHRKSVVERQVSHALVAYQNQPSEEKQEWDPSEFRELGSLEDIISHPVALYCLRKYMTSNLTLNNLQFYMDAIKFKEDVHREFMSLYHKYIDDSSMAQINITTKQFKALAEVKDGNVPLTQNSYDDAISETWKLMKVNIFKPFLRSEMCQFYCHLKRNDPVTMGQLQVKIDL